MPIEGTTALGREADELDVALDAEVRAGERALEVVREVVIELVVLLVGAGVAIVPALQIRLMDVAADAQTLAASLNHSAFNIANALGAWLGGVAIAAGLGWTSTGWLGALLAIGGLLIFAWSLKDEARNSRSDTLVQGVERPCATRAG